MRRRRAPRPPKRRCEDCGGDFFAFGGVVCPACRKIRTANPDESFTETRRRIKGSGY